MKINAQNFLLKLRQEAAQAKWRKSKGLRWTIGIVLTLAIAAFFPRAHSQALSGYSVGTPWTGSDVVAPFSFPVYKNPAKYRQDVQKELEHLYPVYLPDTSAVETGLRGLRRNIAQLDAMIESVRIDTAQAVALADSAKSLGLSKEDWNTIVQSSLPNSSRQTRQSAARPTVIDEAESKLLPLFASIESSHHISDPASEEQNTVPSHVVALRIRPREESLVERDSILSMEAAHNRIYAGLEFTYRRDPAILRALADFASQALVPTVYFSAAKTAENRMALESRVPRSEGLVTEGSRIVSKGDVITPKVKAELESLSQARLDRGGLAAEVGRWLGTVGHAGIIVLLIVLYLKFIRRKIYNDNAQLLLLSLMIFFPAVLAFLSIRIQVNFPLEYFILIPATSMMLTILFDSRTGFYGTVIAALIVAGIRGNDYTVALAGLTAGAFAAYTVRDLRSRSQLFKSIGYIFLGYVLSITALAFEQSAPITDMLLMLGAALGNALLSPIITFAALYGVELIFDTVSDLRLTEFDNINHPLLRELSIRAPGTYQHTMLVAQLAENAANAIGANALLAKVGAFFHDVGKLAEPYDFIENQVPESTNVHNELAASESARRVRQHVEQGIDLALAHHLPQKIIDFIPMHHGTLPISFFYEKALAAAKGKPIDESLFRYPGPLPQSRETAIVMLADAAEAVARTVAQGPVETSPLAMEEAIQALIEKRFTQGQLDNCDLTLRDLTIVRIVFARLLAGLHHARISYPRALSFGPGTSNPLMETARENTMVGERVVEDGNPV